MIRRPVFLIVLVFTLLACGSGVNQREAAFKATLTAINQARDGFTMFDRDLQIAIATNVSPPELAAKALADYRKKRELIVDGFISAYQALATAFTAKDTPTFQATLDAAIKILDLFDQFRRDHIKPEPSPP